MVFLISLSEFSLPKVSLKLLFAKDFDCPIPKSTWDGPSDPEVQAEPDEAQMPAISRRIIKDSPSIPLMLILILLGSRLTGSPLRII